MTRIRKLLETLEHLTERDERTRELERAWKAQPRDRGAFLRYLSALVRAGTAIPQDVDRYLGFELAIDKYTQKVNAALAPVVAESVRAWMHEKRMTRAPNMQRGAKHGIWDLDRTDHDFIYHGPQFHLRYPELDDDGDHSAQQKAEKFLQPVLAHALAQLQKDTHVGGAWRVYHPGEHDPPIETTTAHEGSGFSQGVAVGIQFNFVRKLDAQMLSQAFEDA